MYGYADVMREIREDQKLTQKQVAAYLGITQQVYSRYELGINEMPVRYVTMLCELYSVSADILLGRKPRE